jgi:hypothetical protein
MGGGVYWGPGGPSGRTLEAPGEEESEEGPEAVQAPIAKAAARHHVILRLCRAPGRPFLNLTCVLGYSPKPYE